MLADFGKPFSRGESQKIVATVHRVLYLDGVGDDFIEALWRAGELFEFELQALEIVDVEEAVIVEPCQHVSVFQELVFCCRQLAEKFTQALVFRCSFILLVEKIIHQFGCQFHRTEEERYGLLDVGTLLVMVPAQELDVGDVDLVRIVWRIIYIERVLDKLLFVLIERDV